MISEEHKKHSELARAAFGNYGRHEYAIIGTTCENIQQLSKAVTAKLSAKYKCAYVDAMHGNKDALPARQDAYILCTDKLSHTEMRVQKDPGKFMYRQIFNEADLVLVNGNHTEASAQIVVIDKIKEASLYKRLAQLTNVQVLLLNDNVDGIFDFIKTALPHWQSLPILSLNETDNIAALLETRIQQQTAPVHGLVLAGGKSQRMGFDKTTIEWHGKEQRYYMADMLRNICTDVFISCREDQHVGAHYKTITDSFTGLGPYGAILSAFRMQPDNAWLVTACDMPLLDTNTIEYLLQYRNPSAIATTFESPFDGLPEPLITIWEPKAYPVLLSFLAQGYSCPRKVLRNNDVHIIKAPQPEKLANINTVEELQQLQATLSHKTAGL